MTKEEIQKIRDRKKAKNRRPKKATIEQLRKREAKLRWAGTAPLHKIITTKEQADFFMKMIDAYSRGVL